MKQNNIFILGKLGKGVQRRREILLTDYLNKNIVDPKKEYEQIVKNKNK